MARVRRALVVEDETAVRRSIRALLESQGFVCVEAADGAEALRYASDSGLDLIVTDIDMPRLDGFDLLALISKGAFGAVPPPVIVCSEGLDAGPHLQRPELALSAARIAKPLRREDLLEAIASALPP